MHALVLSLQILYAASELCLFDHVYDMQNCTAEDLAKAQGWIEDYTERLLNALVALKFLEKAINSDGKGMEKIIALPKYISDKTLFSIIQGYY